MHAKTFEIRDRGTFIPALAVRLEPGCEADRFLLARAGYGDTGEAQRNYLLLVNLNGGECAANYDPYAWKNRTMHEAHLHLEKHFDELSSGAVIDVEFVLGLTTAPKASEAMAGLANG